jgi:hypothetical protein
MLTHLYLIRAVRPLKQTRMDAIIEATSEGAALQKFQDKRGAFDADADFPYWRDIEIEEIPMLTGEPTMHDIS